MPNESFIGITEGDVANLDKGQLVNEFGVKIRRAGEELGLGTTPKKPSKNGSVPTPVQSLFDNGFPIKLEQSPTESLVVNQNMNTEAYNAQVMRDAYDSASYSRLEHNEPIQGEPDPDRDYEEALQDSYGVELADREAVRKRREWGKPREELDVKTGLPKISGRGHKREHGSSTPVNKVGVKRGGTLYDDRKAEIKQSANFNRRQEDKLTAEEGYDDYAQTLFDVSEELPDVSSPIYTKHKKHKYILDDTPVQRMQPPEPRPQSPDAFPSSYRYDPAGERYVIRRKK